MDLQQILYIYYRVLVTVALYNFFAVTEPFVSFLSTSGSCSFISSVHQISLWWFISQPAAVTDRFVTSLMGVATGEAVRARLKLRGLRHTVRVFVLLCPPTAPMQSGELWRWKWKEAWDKSSSDTSSSGRIKNQVQSINIVVKDFNISAASRPSAAAGNRQTGFNLSHPSLWRIH